MPYIYNFEWDPEKANTNLKKHAVTFEESVTVFKDLNTLSLFDPDHSENEDKWITLGLSEKARLLVVIHTFLEKKDGTVIV